MQLKHKPDTLAKEKNLRIQVFDENSFSNVYDGGDVGSHRTTVGVGPHCPVVVY